MTQQEYAALAIKATTKKTTFAEVVTQSGTNAVNIEGHTGVLTTLLVTDITPTGVNGFVLDSDGNEMTGIYSYDTVYKTGIVSKNVDGTDNISSAFVMMSDPDKKYFALFTLSASENAVPIADMQSGAFRAANGWSAEMQVPKKSVIDYIINNDMYAHIPMADVGNWGCWLQETIDGLINVGFSPRETAGKRIFEFMTHHMYKARGVWAEGVG